MGDIFNTGKPWSRILKPTQNNLLGPTDNVSVGHDTIAVDHKPGAAGAGHWVVSPRGIPNRGLAVHQHLNDRAPHVRRRGQGGQERKKQGREENSHAGKLLATPRDLGSLREQLGLNLPNAMLTIESRDSQQDDLRDWSLDRLPEQVEVIRSGITIPGYHMLIDHGDTAPLRLARHTVA